MIRFKSIQGWPENPTGGTLFAVIDGKTISYKDGGS